MARAIWLTIIMFVLLGGLVSADSEYTSIGEDSHTFLRGEGIWNTELDTSLVTSSTVSIGTQVLYPLVGDLDSNGLNEIYVWNGDDIVVFDDKTLNVLETFNLGGVNRHGQWLLYDIDGDGNDEIVLAGETNLFLRKLDFNGTNLAVSTITFGGTYTDGEAMIGCKGTNDCIVVYTSHTASATDASRAVRAMGFNSTTTYTNELGIDSHNGFSQSNRNGGFCLPKFRFVDDANDRFSFSYASVAENNLDDQRAVIKEVTRSGSTLSVTNTITEDTDMFDTAGAFDCTTDSFGQFLTAPMRHDLSTTTSGVEYVMALQKDADEFKMRVYSEAGSTLFTHPFITDANGDIMSNVMLFNAFDNSDTEDYCVAGYSQTADELNLLCGSLVGSEDTLQTMELEYPNINSIFNVSQDYTLYNAMAHSAQYSQITTNGENLNELVTSYGVFSLDLSGANSLSLEYQNPHEDSVVVPSDFEQVGLEDLLVLTDTNFFYLDDGFTNSPAQITSYTINPCIDAVWQQNTSVNVQVEVTDIDEDQVNSNVTLYLNSPYEQSQASFNASSGTTFNFNFIANQTIGAGTLRMFGRDVENPSELDTIDVSFSVASQGVEFGDCVTTVDIALDEDDEETLQDQLGISEDNAIVTGITQIDEATGLGLGTTMIWLIFMLAVAYVIVTNNSLNGNTKIGTLVISEFAMIVLGALLGFFSTALIVTISIPIILIVVVIGAKFFIGARN